MSPNLKSEKIVAGPVVVDGDVVRLIKLPDGSGGIEVWKPGEGPCNVRSGMCPTAICKSKKKK